MDIHSYAVIVINARDFCESHRDFPINPLVSEFAAK